MCTFEQPSSHQSQMTTPLIFPHSFFMFLSFILPQIYQNSYLLFYFLVHFWIFISVIIFQYRIKVTKFLFIRNLKTQFATVLQAHNTQPLNLLVLCIIDSMMLWVQMNSSFISSEDLFYCCISRVWTLGCSQWCEVHAIVHTLYHFHQFYFFFLVEALSIYQ